GTGRLVGEGGGGIHGGNGGSGRVNAIEPSRARVRRARGTLEPSSGGREGPRRIWHLAGRLRVRWLPRHQRACPSAGLDGAARLPPPGRHVNRFILIER